MKKRELFLKALNENSTVLQHDELHKYKPCMISKLAFKLRFKWFYRFPFGINNIVDDIRHTGIDVDGDTVICIERFTNKHYVVYAHLLHDKYAILDKYTVFKRTN